MNKMMIKAVFIMVLSSTVFVACQMNQKKDQTIETAPMEVGLNVENDIPFRIAERYFVKNTVENIDSPIITTQKDFDALFGAAAVMGEGGMPTEIDFSKENVIAVLKPETGVDTRLVPISLKSNDKNQIVFSYNAIKGEKQTYKIKPCLIIIVDKDVAKDVILNEIE